ncbi:MAG: ABC transporter ATP-binding protein/permease [Oscillospiraceae bacterium]|nr:ABC transporter ATP-binding protein/permease [Oscillospiraceae bacterium]
MELDGVLTNMPIPGEILAKAGDLSDGGELSGGNRPLFALVGDLTLKGRYGVSALFVFKDRLTAFDEKHSGGQATVMFCDIAQAKVKRMYGNAVLRIEGKDGKTLDLLRFTYSVADIGDAAALFVNKINEGEPVDQSLEIVKAAYRNMRSFCPKCGRKLKTPDSECLNCEGKSKVIQKFAKYIKPYVKRLILCLLLSVFTTALALVPPYITKVMVDSVIPGADRSMLLTIILLLLSVYVAQFSVSGIRAYLLRVTGDRIVIELKKDVYAKAQFLPMSFYDKTSTGSVINRINGDTANIQSFMLRITQEAVVQAFTLVGVIIIMLAMDWRLTLLSLIPVPLVVICGRYFGKRVAPMYRRLWRRGTSLYSILSDTIPGVRVIKAFTNEKNTINKYERYANDWLEEDKKASVTVSAFPTVITFLITCGSLIIWLVGGGQVIGDLVSGAQSGITTGVLVSFIAYAGMFYAPVNFFANLNDTYQHTLASAEKILDILNAEPEHDFGKGNKPERIKGKIEFKNVSFSFDRSKKVLDDVSFVIEPGDVVGIVGTTGAGKSTVINLIMRYYDDYEGQILVDGADVKDIDMDHFRGHIGYVQQEPMMFRDTIFNNISYGNPDAHVEQILHAADIANAHGFISRLPDAYDTLLGERGVGLSGGEKQRISIARAVLENPAILIFDEATAAVDSETEHLIQEAIERLIRGRTTLMIAHRLSTLRKANKIMVVDKGQIIEFGPPEELIAMQGKYYKLIQIQSMSEKAREMKEEENLEISIT